MKEVLRAACWDCACGVRHRSCESHCWYCGEAREPGDAAASPRPLRAELKRATASLREGRIGQAAVAVGQVFRDGAATSADRFYAHRIRGEALYAFGNYDAARRELEAAAMIAPRSPAVVYLLGEVHLAGWRTETARDLFERATVLFGGETGEGLARAMHSLAYCIDRLGERDRAVGLFQRAHRMAPTRLAAPFRVDREKFESIARDVLAALPDEARERLGLVSLVVSDYPRRSLLSGAGNDPRMGASVEGDEGSVCAITLFQRNIELGAVDHGALVERVKRIIRHEVARFLGRVTTSRRLPTVVPSVTPASTADAILS